jgi:hypothetical protein
MTREMQEEMDEAAVHVDDIADEEPLHEWDRDNPDMSVGTCYPSMDEFRLAVRQHAIKGQFEMHVEHSDTDRYRVKCGALGCPWILRGKTQHDGSVRVYFLIFVFIFFGLYCPKFLHCNFICYSMVLMCGCFINADSN